LSIITDTSSTLFYTLSLHDALPIFKRHFSFCVSESDLPLQDRFSEGLSCVFFKRGFYIRQRFDLVYGTDQIAQIIQNLRILFVRSEEHTSELQSRFDLVCRLLLEKK